MINTTMKNYNFFAFGEADAYGQPTLSTKAGEIKIAIETISKTTHNSPLYANATYIGLTLGDIQDNYVIDYNGKLLKVNYIQPRGRYKQVFLEVLEDNYSKQVFILKQPNDLALRLNYVGYINIETTEAYSYQWQYRYATSNTWISCRNGSIFKATNTNKLQVSARADINGIKLRCCINANSTSEEIYTEEATFTVI